MILMNDFQREPSELRQALLHACEAVINSGQYILGGAVREFERRWASLCGSREGVGVGNGMDAIEIALRASGIGVGNEVVTTSMTAFATVLAVLRSGATPVLGDIDPATGLLDMESVRRCLTSRTKAVIVVHLYGQMRNMCAWRTFCDEHGLVLIEDCAQAHLARLEGVTSGGFGNSGCFSFYPTKNLGAIGDAGMLVTNDLSVADRARMLRNYGQVERYRHEYVGLNSRLDEIHAAMLIAKLEWLPRFTERRREIASIYYSEIKCRGIENLAQPQEPEAHVHHLHVLRCSKRDQLADHLKRVGVQTLIHYPLPMHLQRPCLGFARDPHGLRNAEEHATHCLSIPCQPMLTDSEVFRVVDAVNSFRSI